MTPLTPCNPHVETSSTPSNSRTTSQVGPCQPRFTPIAPRWAQESERLAQGGWGVSEPCRSELPRGESANPTSDSASRVVNETQAVSSGFNPNTMIRQVRIDLGPGLFRSARRFVRTGVRSVIAAASPQTLYEVQAPALDRRTSLREELHLAEATISRDTTSNFTALALGIRHTVGGVEGGMF